MRCFVGDVMSTEPLCLLDDTPAAEAADVMRALGVGSAVVIGSGRSPGVLTYPQITQRINAADGRPTLREILRDGSVAVQTDDLLQTAFEIMRSHGLDRLPVCRRGVPVGILTRQQVAPSAVREVSTTVQLSGAATAARSSWRRAIRPTPPRTSAVGK
jgi:predicted transcriptional regulator